MKPKGVTTQMKALDEYFLMVVKLLRFVQFKRNIAVNGLWSSRSKKWK